MTTIVETIIAPGFFHRLGVYAQTCAHIERVLWLIVIHDQGLDMSNKDQVNKALRPRKVTGNLLRDAKATAARIGGAQGPALTEILDHIDREHHARHMAIHGAWRSLNPTTHTCEYFRDFGGEGNPDWRHYADEIPDDQIALAVETVNDLLRRLLEVLASIQGRAPDPNGKGSAS